MNDKFIEVSVANITFRIRKERTLLADSIIEKIFSRDGTIGAHEVIKADCQIFDRENKKWRIVTDEDLENIPRMEGREKLVAKILELRKVEMDFQKSQLLKQSDGSGLSKMLSPNSTDGSSDT